MAVIRPNAEPAATSVATGDIFLIDGATGVRALAATSVAFTNTPNTFTGTQTVPALVATTINGNTITTGTGVLTLGAGKTLTANNTLTLAGVDGKTLTVNNSLALAGTDGTTHTFPSTSATLARTDAGQTFTGTNAFGVLTATTINGNTFTPGTGILTIAAAKTLTVSNSLTLAGTDGTTQTFPATSGTVLTSVSVASGDLTGTYPGPTIAANAVTNAKMAQMAAKTLKGNATNAAANASDIVISSLTDIATPNSTLDWILIEDHVSGTIKKTNASELTAAVGSGVTSIAGVSGVLTISHGLTNSASDLQIDIGTQRSYLAGLTLSTAGSSATFSVAAGVAVDSTQSDFMKLASAYSKTTGAWAVGTGNGALDTGTIANSTWYHAHQIKRPDTGVVDVLISLSATAPTLPANYTLFRRIGSMKTNGSGQWVLFHQLGDEFLWDAPVAEINGTIPTTPTLLTLAGIPAGVQVLARIRGFGSGSGANGLLMQSPDETSAAGNATQGNLDIIWGAGGQSGGNFLVRVNTAAQVRWSAATTTGNGTIASFGWIDRRGRDV